MGDYAGLFRVDGLSEAVVSAPVKQGDLLHLAAVTADGHLWHTIRYSTGWAPFGDVEGEAGDRGLIVDVDLRHISNELHVCAINDAGGLWHTIRRADGSWLPFGDVEGETGDCGFFVRVGLAELSGELHVCGVTSDGHLWHAIRRADGSWFPFGDVEGEAGDRGFFVDVDCAGVNGELHVCGVTNEGHLWHAIRRSTGRWTGFGDVERQTGDRGTIREVACASVAGQLHVCSVSSNGRLWHTIRTNDGWSSFGDVEGQAGDRGRFVRVSVGEVGGELHVAGITDDGRLWHTIRRANGWVPFASVSEQAGNPGSFRTVGVDGMFVLLPRFKTGRDGFRFKNEFQITETNAAQMRRWLTRELVEEVVETAALRPIRHALGALKIPIPLLPDISIPAVVIGKVIETILPTAINSLFDQIVGSIPGTYGRCGGMAFAGYDFYLAGWPVDERLGTTPPNTGPLGEYIFDRLLDSLDLNLRTFLEWITKLHVLPVLSRAATVALSAAAGSVTIPGVGTLIGAYIGTKLDVLKLGGKGPVLADAKGEWSKLKSILVEQAAWPVGLIYGNSAIPWNQHQVLAIGCEDNGDGTGRLITWDNNFPGNDTVYDVDFRGSELKSSLDPNLKGFFAERYEPRMPPAELKLS